MANWISKQTLQTWGGGEINKNYFDFDTTPTGVPTAEWVLSWNSTDDTLDLQATNITYQIGQELSPLYKNQTGATIPNGTPVMFAWSLWASGRITIQKAIADGSIPAMYTIGITTEDILNWADGHVTWFGKIRGLDTTGTPYGETWEDWDIIYVSPTTAGHLTKVKPNAPDLQIVVAAVVNAHASNGTLFTRPTWGFKLEDLDNVNGTPLTTSWQFPVWNQTTGYFDFDNNINDLGSNTLSGTIAIDFWTENDRIATTISSLLITNTNIKGFSYIPMETTETSLDDFTNNNVMFNIENIVDNVSFDITGSSGNNATGNYTIKYLITY